MKNIISYEEFKILDALEEGNILDKNDLQNVSNIKEIDSLLLKFENEGIISDFKLTEKGYELLKPFKAKRAVFLAAGFGSRMVPITLNTPKPLVRVNNIRIIDRLIDACISKDINEIYIVRGYLKEQFDQLLYKYPMIKFIDNDDYDKANNISSALVAKDLLENAYVLESDLVINNPNIIKKYNYYSSVLGIYKKETDDWALIDKDGFVDEEIIGGKDCWQMVGIYYFNSNEGKMLKDDLALEFSKEDGKNRYWETVPNQVHRGKYKIIINECREDDIVEIDTYNELTLIDPSYKIKE